MAKKYIKVFYISTIILLITILAFQLFSSNNEKKKLLSTGVIAMCTIDKIEEGSRFRNSICYSYSYNGNPYKDCVEYDISNRLKHRLLNTQIPIIFSKDNPKINQILLFEGEFKLYNLNYPDSLKWVEELR